MPRKPTPLPAAVSNPSMNIALDIYQGDDKKWVFRIKQSDGSPLLLVGHTAAAQFRVYPADVDTTATADATIEITDPVNGEVTMTLTSSESRALSQPLYSWDLEITDTAVPWTTTVLGGTLVVTPEITRVVAT
jgi:hypothetical protein